MQIIKKPKWIQDDSDSDEHEMNDNSKSQIVSELHCFTGPKFSNHAKLQIGHICPDEVLDLELDTNVWSVNDSVNESNNTSFNSGVADSVEVMKNRNKRQQNSSQMKRVL